MNADALPALAAAGVGLSWSLASWCSFASPGAAWALALCVVSILALGAWIGLARRQASQRATTARRAREWARDYTRMRGWVSARWPVPEELEPSTRDVLARVHSLMHAQAQRESDASAELSREMGLQMRLVAMASHDLRSPLNSITGFADILSEELDGPLGDAQRSSVRAIRHASDDLLQLVTGILDCARLEAGLLELLVESAPCAPTVAEALDQATARVGRPIAARLRLPQDLGELQMDRARVVQALASVLEHASRVSDTPLELKVRRDGAMMEVIVASQGLPSDATGVFDAFRAVRDSSGGRIPGLGFGLALARGVAELHGGSLEYEPRGSGAAFVLRL